MVIIDEVVGQWMTFLPFASLSFRDLVLGFLLFRIFDIFKPWPVNISEQWFSHGWSIMIDDICAAIYAVFCLAVLRCIF
jgi:phosphatidylglycerophosphatase A